MVLADRAVENVRNGRRSRGPSPNGHSATVVIAGGVTESSSDDENCKLRFCDRSSLRNFNLFSFLFLAARKNGNSSKATKAKSEYEGKEGPPAYCEMALLWFRNVISGGASFFEFVISFFNSFRWWCSSNFHLIDKGYFYLAKFSVFTVFSLSDLLFGCYFHT